MPQLWICFYTAASGGQPLKRAEIATGLEWINFSIWLEVNKDRYPRLADLGNRMESGPPFKLIEEELRLLLTASLTPPSLKTVARALQIGVLSKPDDTTLIAITDGKKDGDDVECDGE
jgi:hypothetical protein